MLVSIVSQNPIELEYEKLPQMVKQNVSLTEQAFNAITYQRNLSNEKKVQVTLKD